MTPEFAPGARVLIRSEEWVVRDVMPCDMGGWQLECLGVSELVQNREGIFLSALDPVQVLDPATTELVGDDTPEYLASRLYLEARLRQTVPTGEQATVGHLGAMDTLPFQLEPVHRVLRQLRPRFLIADSVGLGKTLEAGILVSELMRRGKGRRILVVTTKSMMQQFQKEFWTRFSIPLTRLDSAGIQRIRRELPANHNPFHYHDKTIISVDTLKRDTEYRHYLETAHWDAIVIDEAHNVSFKGSRTMLSYKLATLLSTRSDALILLTATPHNGDRESFASLMRMLDPTILPRKADYTREDVHHLFVRRFKKDVRDQIKADFPERRVFRFPAKLTAPEEAAFQVLADLKLHIDEGKRGGAEMLFRTTLEKSLLSSPAACLQTVKERIKRLSARDPQHPDIAPLTELQQAVERIAPADIAKLNELLRRLKEDPLWRWSPNDAADRLVIFTERIETLKLLQNELPARLGLKDKQIAVLHGQLPDTEIQQTVESFGQSNSPLRLLIASDVASEGINLHFQSHRLVHFDVPWSLMVFQQRNGRVDRYGQTQTPLIAYLTTETVVPRIKGDVRILEILIEKDEQAAQNIGDPSIFMGLYDEELETRRVAEAIEAGESAETFAATLNKEDDALDWLDALMTDAPSEPTTPQPPSAASFFASDYAYLSAGLDCLHRLGHLQRRPQTSDAHQTVQFQPEAELAGLITHQLSAEMRPTDNVYSLTGNRDAIKQDIKAARDGDRWPHQQLLWPMHPVLQWLDLKLISIIGRQKAPVIRVPTGVADDEALVLLAALIPNRRGQPVLNEWFVERIGLDGKTRGRLSLEQVMEQTGLGLTALPNAGKSFDAKRLQALLKPALQHAKEHMTERHRAFQEQTSARAKAELDKLEALRQQHQQQLQLNFKAGEDALAKLREAKRDNEARDINTLFSSYRSWISQTLELDGRAHLTVAAVVIANSSTLGAGV